jgi:acyl carrier protein
MVRENIERTILNYLVQEHGLDEKAVSNSQALYNEGYVDSILALQLIEFFERTYSFKVDVFDLSVESFNSIGSMASLIETRV